MLAHAHVCVHACMHACVHVCVHLRIRRRSLQGVFWQLALERAMAEADAEALRARIDEVCMRVRLCVRARALARFVMD